jgi:hypothetical protein
VLRSKACGVAARSFVKLSQHEAAPGLGNGPMLLKIYHSSCRMSAWDVENLSDGRSRHLIPLNAVIV